MKRRVLYSEANYAAIVRDHGYFVDKTAYVAQLEQVRNPVFLRPRRFGKTLLCSILRHYYDLNTADQFETLFGHTWIGQHRTGRQNQYIILALNFSTIVTGPTIDAIERSFRSQCNYLLDSLRYEYAPLLDELPPLPEEAPVADNLRKLLIHLRTRRLPSLYVVIDEYDNFSNQLIINHKDELYRQLTADEGFFKTFFKTLKEGRETNTIANIFVTGVLPILIDELASGFNIATILTLDREFEAMLGFTQSEVDQLLDTVYTDYDIDPATRPIVDTVIKNHYNGYHFINTQGEAPYNSTILMYFLREFTVYQQIPEFLTDLNLRTDLMWIRRLTSAHPGDTEAFVEALTSENQIAYDKNFLTTKFNTFQFFTPGFYPISFFYLGMLTRQDDFFLKLPNLNLRQIFIEYFNEIHHIDVSTLYAEMMQSFVNQPNLEQLFAGYWREYVSQLPEAVFTRMNENFYRITFYELCSRYLSRWFTWNLERSYPSGKSDLEFVGKYHEKFAGLRWVIEFKYYSNAELRALNKTVDTFTLQQEDTEQIGGYAADLRREYPEAAITKFVIYCFGNSGFRVFPVT